MKLEHALREFGVDVAGLVCADFGCNVGGFTDCLLQHGAAKVYAIDTGYGVLDYRLRTDNRVVVMERTNVLHAELPWEGKRRKDPHPQPLSRRERGERTAPFPGGEEVRGVDLVTIDVGWTRQQHAIPAARKWLPSEGRIITLIKPHYELEADEKKAWLVDGALPVDRAQQIFERVLANLGVEVLASTTSPIRGAKSSRKKKNEGNVEYLVLARKAAAQ